MSIESLAEDLENAYEGSLGEEPPSKKEREESRKSFVEGLTNAVKNGGQVIVEPSNGVNLFYFKEKNRPVKWCISERDAIDICGYKTK